MTAANPDVPRGTLSTAPTVRPLLFRKEMRLAIEQGIKRVTRRTLAAGNCVVSPGDFKGLRLDTGRARQSMRPYLRAQCEFDSGRVRVVSVLPAVEPGDLFYVKANRYTSRAKSTLTLKVTAVCLSRLQDMTNEDAELEGVAVLDLPTLAPRDAFALLWDRINGAGSWASNPWCWAYKFEGIAHNVDRVLEREIT